MTNLIKKPYEISLWEDKITFVTATKEYVGKIPPINESIIGQYFKEIKKGVIGSNTMTSPIKAINPQLKMNVNGTSTLTFQIYSHYRDDEGQLLDNPYTKMLLNESKIKLRYGAVNDCKWYDFVIKKIDEDSENKIFTYTAEDLFINELSKTGFKLEFDKDLENNMGNISTLANRILAESDWKLKSNLPVLEQKKEEPVYQISLASTIIAKNVKNENKTLEIKKGSQIYTFYSVIENKENYFQFIYVPSPNPDDHKAGYTLDDRKVVTNKDCNYYIKVAYRGNKIYYIGETTGKEILLTQVTDFQVSSDFRAERYVRKQLTCYDSTVDKYVSIYTMNGEDVYGYVDHEYLSTNMVKTFITNPNNFTSLSGWQSGLLFTWEEGSIPDLNVAMVPDVRDVGSDYDGDFTSYLTYKQNSQKDQVLFNSGVIDFKSSINGFAKDEKYTFRIKYGIPYFSQGKARASEVRNAAFGKERNDYVGVNFKVAFYQVENGCYVFPKNSIIFEGTVQPGSGADTSKQYQSVELICQRSVSYKDMLSSTNKIGIFINFTEPKGNVSSNGYYIEDVQFFKSQYDSSNQLVLPNQDIEGKVKTIYCYYKPNKDYKKEEDIEFLYRDSQPASSSTFVPKYNTNSFEKIRMINGSESNRFNLLQTLCETFECWVKFEIDHKNTGEILLGKDSPHWDEWGADQKAEEQYRQQKWVSFYESVQKENYSGFKYGINLKAIKRNVESNGIISKIIVKNNSNEFAQDGFCSIARSDENFAKENFILDFGYYIQQGMLDFNAVNNDLYIYSEAQGYLGYYKRLREINKRAQQLILDQSLLSTDIINYTSQVKNYSLQLEKTQEELNRTYSVIRSLCGLTFEELKADPDNKWWEEDEIIAKANLVNNLKKTISIQTVLTDQAKEQLNKAQTKYDAQDQELKNKVQEKESINKAFYRKYSRFIQEGSWISEDYVDDNLYYLDAESTLHISSQPKVGYNINVLELSQLPGYENYKFELGEKTYIEDVEFFGWSYKNQLKTPYHEEVIVTELTLNLDNPEQNNITIQNYKTQFEDLFQRITATTQAVEFSSGQYDKVSNVIESNGDIKLTTLQNSITNNSLVLQNAKNQSVIWDETGITTTSLSAPNEIVRIVSGGIFLSEDGGLKWNTGITGKGINANYITTGQLNTSQINILNGSFPSFRWDNSGISAYKFEVDQQSGAGKSFSYGTFIRLDQFGLYGINGDNKFNAAVQDKDGLIGEKKIRKYSDFALTWSGFQIKSKHKTGGYVSITSEGDIEVFNGADNPKAQVKIGLLSQENEIDNPVYGLRLMDASGTTVLEQSNNGKVWIRDQIKIGQVSSTVSIGYLPETEEENSKNHAVINAANKFLVYEDGTMKATNGYFEGTGSFTGRIVATGGSIGGLDIESFIDGAYQAAIESDSGTFFRNGAGIKKLTAKLYQGNKEVLDKKLTYQWYRQGEKIPGATTKFLEVGAEGLNAQTESAIYTCTIEMIK